MSALGRRDGSNCVRLTIQIFCQTSCHYKTSESSSCHDIIIRAIDDGRISKNDRG